MTTLTVAMASAQEPGVWTGSTSQGRTFRMTIDSNAITQIVVGFSVCSGGVNGTATISTNTPVAVGGSFNVNAGGVCPGIAVSGTFGTSSTASGTVALTTSYIPGVCPCSGMTTPTWTAAAPPVPIFVDDFEGGTTGAWSSVTA